MWSFLVIMAKHPDKQFREYALRYRKYHPGLKVARVCRNLSISTPIFYNWKNQAKENDGEVIHIGSGNHASKEDKEMLDLEKN